MEIEKEIKTFEFEIKDRKLKNEIKKCILESKNFLTYTEFQLRLRVCEIEILFEIWYSQEDWDELWAKIEDKIYPILKEWGILEEEWKYTVDRLEIGGKVELMPIFRMDENGKLRVYFILSKKDNNKQFIDTN